MALPEGSACGVYMVSERAGGEVFGGEKGVGWRKIAKFVGY